MLKRQVSKSIIFIAVFLLAILNAYAADPPGILEIRKQFQLWQTVIKNDSDLFKKYYHIYDNENYDQEEWVTTHVEDSTKFLAEHIEILKNEKLGLMFKLYEIPPSGDWSSYSEHYYGPDQKLFFVFWTMDTYFAEVPTTVERRIYFDKNGKKIRTLESVYKLNTKIKLKGSDYMVRDFNYWLKLEDLPFYHLIKI